MAEEGAGYTPAPPNTPWEMYERTPAASLWVSDNDAAPYKGHGWTYITDIPDANASARSPWREI
jgi:hypothetical protein